MPVIVIVSVLAFLLLSLLPGDPAVVIAGDAGVARGDRTGPHATRPRPAVARTARSWLFNRLAQGDFGNSLILNQSVLSAVVERLPVTLSLAALSISFTIPVGVLPRGRSPPIFAGPGSTRW